MSTRPKWLKNIDLKHSQQKLSIVEDWLAQLIAEIKSPYNDGFTRTGLKKELFEFKCLLEDVYDSLPDFGDEEVEWEKERLYNKLKRKSK